MRLPEKIYNFLKRHTITTTYSYMNIIVASVIMREEKQHSFLYKFLS